MGKRIKKPNYKKDPSFQKEKDRYSNPTASRALILKTLEEYGRPLSEKKLISSLEIEDPTTQEALGFRLKAMVRDGQIMLDRRGRYCLLQRINLEKGTIQAHPDGFGFFIPDKGGDDLFLSAKEMRAVMHGDVVLAFHSGVDRRG